MDTQELRTLRLLEEIEGDQAPSQRDLASRLNISLGLVNSFIKRLTQKGYFKITTIPRNRVKYILTPKGAAEKTRLTYEYIQYSIFFYRDVRKRLDKVVKQFEKDHVKKVLFIGTGELTEIAYLSFKGSGILICGFVDENRAGELFLGRTIQGAEAIVGTDADRVLVTEPDKNDKIVDDLVTAGITRDRIVCI